MPFGQLVGRPPSLLLWLIQDEGLVRVARPVAVADVTRARRRSAVKVNDRDRGGQRQAGRKGQFSFPGFCFSAGIAKSHPTIWRWVFLRKIGDIQVAVRPTNFVRVLGPLRVDRAGRLEREFWVIWGFLSRGYDRPPRPSPSHVLIAGENQIDIIVGSFILDFSGFLPIS